MADIFDVVDRELAEEKQREQVRKYAPLLIGAMIAIVLGVALFSAFSERQESAAEADGEIYTLALSSLENGNVEAARTRFEQLAENGGQAYRVLAKQQLAQLALSEGRDFFAVGNILGDAAAESNDEFYAGAAQLKALYVRLDGLPYSEAESQLYTLMTDDSSPYQLLAEEMLAAKALEAGRYEEAAEMYERLTRGAVPPGLRQRASEAAALARTLLGPHTKQAAAQNAAYRNRESGAESAALDATGGEEKQ